MHLWPSIKIRDSFKLAYLKKLEWNLHCMKIEKESPDSQKKLLENQGDNEGKSDGEIPPISKSSGIAALCSELLMLVSCCYCCFCCGACVDQEGN